MSVNWNAMNKKNTINKLNGWQDQKTEIKIITKIDWSKADLDELQANLE